MLKKVFKYFFKFEMSHLLHDLNMKYYSSFSKNGLQPSEPTRIHVLGGSGCTDKRGHNRLFRILAF